MRHKSSNEPYNILHDARNSVIRARRYHADPKHSEHAEIVILNALAYLYPDTCRKVTSPWHFIEEWN